jgi:hypothetical protein
MLERFTGEEKIVDITDGMPLINSALPKILECIWYKFDFNGKIKIGIPREQLERLDIFDKGLLDDCQLFDWAIRGVVKEIVPQTNKTYQIGTHAQKGVCWITH